MKEKIMKNNQVTKMTAVDCLMSKIEDDFVHGGGISITKIFEHVKTAKGIEREQIIGAHFDGQYFEKCFFNDENHSSKEAEDYYKNYYGE